MNARLFTRSTKGMALLLLGLCSLQAPAQLSNYNVLDTRTTSYDVDKNNRVDTQAFSQWVQGTWLNLPQPQFAAMQWVETSLVDFYSVEYDWGPAPNPPGLHGWFNASRALGIQLGNSTSRVAWSAVTRSSGYAINAAPLRFDVQDCFLFSCTLKYSVTLDTSGSSTAEYHTPTGTGSGTGAGSSGSSLRATQASSLLSGSAPISLDIGESLVTGASLDVVDTASAEVVDNLLQLISSVERLATGQYLYTYQMINNADIAIEALWAAAGFDGDPVELPSDSESALLSLLSDRAPVERTSIAELNLVGAFSSLPMFGAAQILQPVPLPASAWLLIAALTSIAVRARTVGRARD